MNELVRKMSTLVFNNKTRSIVKIGAFASTYYCLSLYVLLRKIFYNTSYSSFVEGKEYNLYKRLFQITYCHYENIHIYIYIT